MTRAFFRLCCVFLLLAACTYTPPGTVAPVRAPTPVQAPFTRAWNAVIDVFADRNIPIRTIDRASGFAATEALSVNSEDGKAWADCGATDGGPLGPERATYNVLVRGDSTASTVRITVTWSTTVRLADGRTPYGQDCTTRGVWEADVESKIKAIAEGQGRAP
jgi:hypothetical protein